MARQLVFFGLHDLSGELTHHHTRHHFQADKAFLVGVRLRRPHRPTVLVAEADRQASGRRCTFGDLAHLLWRASALL